jgi:hypothetical protein
VARDKFAAADLASLGGVIYGQHNLSVTRPIVVPSSPKTSPRVEAVIVALQGNPAIAKMKEHCK